MTAVTLIIIAGLIIAGVVLVSHFAPAKSKLMVAQEGSHFPTVSGYNLNRQEYEFPRDFSGDLNLVMVAFQQRQQFTINTWIPFAQEVEAKYPNFFYYELPTIYEMPALSRTFINEGMRAGIPDRTARERTITFYLDKDSFRSALDIPGEEDIHLFLVDREGKILWRTTGAYSESKASELIQAIEAHSQ